MKGQGNQVSNGPKEQLGAGEGATGSEEFEPWRPQQPTSAAHAYGASVPISSATDLYNISTAGYYGNAGTYPYQAYGVGDGTWSNGTDPMTFLSGYPHDSYSMDGMFGPSTTYSTPTAFAGQPSSFNYFHSNGDYSTWGNQLTNQRKYDDYYRDAQQNVYAQAMPDSLKSVEQAMQNLGSGEHLSDVKLSYGFCLDYDLLFLPKSFEKEHVYKDDIKSNDSKDSMGQPKKLTWASIASQPAKPQLTIQNQGLKKKGPGMPPGPIVPGKHNMDIGTWDTSKNTPPQLPMVNSAPTGPAPPPPKSMVPSPLAAVPRPTWGGPPTGPPVGVRGGATGAPPPRPPPQHALPPAYQSQGMLPPPPPPHLQHPQVGVPTPSHLQGMMPPQPMPMIMQPPTQSTLPTHPVLDELRGKNNYNPPDFDLTAPNARFFVIKSYSEDDIHRSIKYEIWCSTEHGNKRLDQAYRERDGSGVVYLFFSVNGSGHFCGMAQMVSPVDYNANSSVWSQDKWKGQFKVRWIYVKDVPNVQLRHIRLENNDNKPVTNSRDTQEVPHPKGLQVLRIVHSYRHTTSIFDDFVHYEQRQEEEDSRKQPVRDVTNASHEGGGGHREHRDKDSHKDRRSHDGDRDGQRPQHRGDRGEHHNGHHKDRGDNIRGRGGRSGRN